MKNVELTVEGTMLTIKVDLTQDFGPSSSGKTIIIASPVLITIAFIKSIPSFKSSFLICI